MMTGTIEINGLRLMARHGVDPQETRVGNLFEVSVRLRYPLEEAAATDDVGSTLNYAEAIEVIKLEMEIPSALLEHVASRIRSALLKKFPLIEGGMVRVSKITPPVPAELSSVAIVLEW
ncbi:MAG: dihydroneopterin aldolase [Muribaculaceae bacterium]|nr:dihydroneopterin aldolase [Muribaculaceae bacterium]